MKERKVRSRSRETKFGPQQRAEIKGIPGWIAFCLPFGSLGSISVASGLRVASPPPKPLPGPSWMSLIMVMPATRAGRVQTAEAAGRTDTPVKAETGVKANMIGYDWEIRTTGTRTRTQAEGWGIAGAESQIVESGARGFEVKWLLIWARDFEAESNSSCVVHTNVKYVPKSAKIDRYDSIMSLVPGLEISFCSRASCLGAGLANASLPALSGPRQTMKLVAHNCHFYTRFTYFE
jgi:hypothetical protein